MPAHVMAACWMPGRRSLSLCASRTAAAADQRPARALDHQQQRHSRRPWLHRNVISAILVTGRAASSLAGLVTSARAVCAHTDSHRPGNSILCQRNLHRVARVMGQSPALACICPGHALSLFCSAALPSGHHALMPRCPGNVAVCDLRIDVCSSHTALSVRACVHDWPRCIRCQRKGRDGVATAGLRVSLQKVPALHGSTAMLSI